MSEHILLASYTNYDKKKLIVNEWEGDKIKLINKETELNFVLPHHLTQHWPR